MNFLLFGAICHRPTAARAPHYCTTYGSEFRKMAFVAKPYSIGVRWRVRTREKESGSEKARKKKEWMWQRNAPATFLWHNFLFIAVKTLFAFAVVCHLWTSRNGQCFPSHFYTLPCNFFSRDLLKKKWAKLMCWRSCKTAAAAHQN